MKADGDVEALAQHLSKSPGVVMIAHEALTPKVVAGIGEHLACQPDWSELPILVLLEPGAPQTRIREQLQRSWPGCCEDRLPGVDMPVTDEFPALSSASGDLG